MFAPPHLAGLLLALLLSAVAAAYDLHKGLIPNRLLGVGAIAALLLRVGYEVLVRGQSARAVLLASLCGAAACAVVPLALYVSKGIGGGDVKLLTLMGGLLGPHAGVEVESYAFALGSLFAFGYLAYRGTLFRTLYRSLMQLVPALPGRPARMRPQPEPALSFRFGPAICAGVLLTVVRHLSVS